jgi:general stress protein 26
MAEMNLADIAEEMMNIDFAMFSTHAPGGGIATRPMSNNAQVDDNGDSYYFTTEDAEMVGEIATNPNVSLGFQGEEAFFVAVAGKAELIRDMETFEEHWTEDLDEWFDDGIETEGLVLIKVHAVRLHYWDEEDEGEIEL